MPNCGTDRAFECDARRMAVGADFTSRDRRPDMSDATPTRDLHALEDSYRIVGELRASDSTRRFVGSRNEDGAPIMVTLVKAPAGGETNELSHYASDVKLLASLRHPSVLAVFDGRWVGNDFAVVTDRPRGTTLEDELDRETEFRNPHIAMVLQDIWSGLEAAREHGIVHRWVTLDTVYFDSSSKRPMVLPLPAPIPLTGVPGAAADARTIGLLAWAMLTGADYDPKANRKLAELAPNLASRVVETVERLVQLRAADPAPDVPTALGIIAAGDVLKQGEIEIQAMKEEYAELHRIELEKCETHRMETEQYAAEQAALITDERALLERLATEQSSALAAERAEFEQLMSAREERILDLRRDLEREAARVAAGMDAEGTKAFTFDDADMADHPQRSLWPTAIGAVILLLFALGALVHARKPREPRAGHVAIGSSVIVPTMPSIDTSRLKAGGFLSQSAAGTVARTSPSGPPLATLRAHARVASDSAAADSAAREARESPPQETIPRRPVRPREPANDVNGVIPRERFDSLAPRPGVDSVQRNPVRPADTVPRDTAIRRDSAPPRSNVRVETTYVRGTVRRDTLAIRPDTMRRRPPVHLVAIRPSTM
jgi:hypothetical protein